MLPPSDHAANHTTGRQGKVAGFGVQSGTHTKPETRGRQVRVSLIDIWRSSPRSEPVEHALASIDRFIRSAVVGSIFLLISAIVALIWANSAFSEIYFALWEMPLGISLGELTFSLTLHQWVNEALMMIFFLTVGMEVKEQVLVGELSSPRHAMLPIGAALGGMIAPALIYALFNGGTPTEQGWGIPMATDIAFALGVLALLGKRVPFSLKIFLAALAIADDIGSIMVITLFYSGELNVTGLLIAGFFWFILFTLRGIGLWNGALFFLLSIGVWVGFLVSGVHATIAGVAVAITIPGHSLIDPRLFFQRSKKLWQNIDKRFPEIDLRSGLHDTNQQEVISRMVADLRSVDPPLHQLQYALQPWVTFLVMPLFALSNAGVRLSGDPLATLTSPVSLGILCGLFLGKQIGITLSAFLMVRLGVASLPQGVTWRHIYGVSILAGIGFTVALFITELAFTDHHIVDQAKTAILFASFVAGVVGFLILRGLPVPASDEVGTQAEPSP
jgi:Na+:H+ antiporter, NhaA family